MFYASRCIYSKMHFNLNNAELADCIEPFIKTLPAIVLHGWAIGSLDHQAPGVKYYDDPRVLEPVLE